MRRRLAKSSAGIQGRDGLNAARMRDALRSRLGFSGAVPEKLGSSGSVAGSEERRELLIVRGSLRG